MVLLFALQHLLNVEVKFSDEEKLEYSKHIVRALLPALEQFNTEQMIERQIECQIHGIKSLYLIYREAVSFNRLSYTVGTTDY